MEIKINIPFSQLIELVRKLNPKQKELLRKELKSESSISDQNTKELLTIIADGPVYKDAELEKIRENRQSISEWRRTA
jgi:predicted transcriptional regulator